MTPDTQAHAAPTKGSASDRLPAQPPPAASADAGETRLFSLSTVLPEGAVSLRALRGREAVSEPFAFELDLVVHAADANVGELLGTPVCFAIDADVPRTFHGFVQRLSAATDAVSGERSAKLLVGPWLDLLSHSQDCRVFQDRSVPQILEELFNDHGFGDRVKFELRADYASRDYCVQYGESAADFAHRLMEDEGIFYTYEHSSEGHTLVLCDDAIAYRRCDALELRLDPDARSGRCVGAWERDRLWSSTRRSSDAFDYHAPRSRYQSGTDTLFGTGAFESYEYAGELRGGGPRPAARARRHMEAQEASFERVRGESRSRGLAPLTRIDLVPVADENWSTERGTQVALVVEHEAVDPSQAQAEGRAPYQNRFEAMPADRVFRAARRTPYPTLAGPQTAIVVGPKDEELHVDALGRVRVCFHWDRGDAPIGENSCWMRVAQPWAGKSHGFQFLPRVGDEVLVSFLGGHPDHPVIIGSLCNTDAQPMHALPAQKDHSGIKTHSLGKDAGFNELRFEDKGGKERVFVHSQRRFDVRARGSTYETTGGSREIRVGSEDGGLNTYVEHDQNHHVVNDRFEQVDGENHRVVGGAEFERCEKTRRIWAGEKVELTAADFIVQTSGQVSQFSTEQVIEGTHEVSIKGGCVHIEALSELCLSVGSNHIKIDASGIHIEGLPVQLNCGSTPSGGPSAETITDLPEPKSAFDAYGAYTGKPSTGRGGGGPRKPRTNDPVPTPVHQPKRFVPPPPPTIEITTVDPDASISSITARCEHAGHAGTRTVPQGGTLDVVPGGSVSLIPMGRATNVVQVDNVDFTALPNPAEPPESIAWKIAGPGGTERAFEGESFTAPFQALTADSPWIPDHEPATYAVEAEAVGGDDPPLALTVRAFPAPREITPPDLDLLELIRRPLNTAGDLIWSATGMFDLEVGDEISWVKAGWQESNGAKAFFGYDVGAILAPALRTDMKFPIGPNLGSLQKFINRIKIAIRSAKTTLSWLSEDDFKRIDDVLDRVVNLGAHGIFRSDLKLDFQFERSSISQPLFVDAKAIGEGNRVGLSGTNWYGLRTLLPIPAPPPLNLISPTLGNSFMEARIGISFSAEPFIDATGYGLKNYGAAFEGLEFFAQYVDPTLTQTLDVIGSRDDFFVLIEPSEDKLFEIGHHYLGRWDELRAKD